MYPQSRVKNDGSALDTVDQDEFDAAITALQLGGTLMSGTTSLPSIIIGTSDLAANEGDVVIANQLNTKHINVHGLISQNTTDGTHASSTYYDSNGASAAGMGTNLVFPAWFSNSWSYDSTNLYNIIGITNDAVASNRSVEIDAPLTVKGITCGNVGISLFTGAINSSFGNINLTIGILNVKGVDVHAKLVQLKEPRPIYIGADLTQHSLEIAPITIALVIKGGKFYGVGSLTMEMEGRLTISEGLYVNLPTAANYFFVNTNEIDRFVITSDGDILYTKNTPDTTTVSLRYEIATLIDELDDAEVMLQEMDVQLQAEKTKVITLESQMADVLARLSALEV